MEDGGPAFPISYEQHWAGMSLRDWFAGQALVGLIALDMSIEQTAKCAYQAADEMIKRRKG